MRIGYILMLMISLAVAGCDASNGQNEQSAGNGEESAPAEETASSGSAYEATSEDEASDAETQSADNNDEAGGEKTNPSWMQPGDGEVAFDVIAGWSSQNNGWNFNGYADGEITVVVPKGAKVKIDFVSQDGNYPHSLIVIDDPRPEGNLPPQAGMGKAAFSRAYTLNPTQGFSSGKGGGMTFTADEAGDYLWYCGVPGHGPSGMWVYFKVRDDVDEAYVRIPSDAEGRR